MLSSIYIAVSGMLGHERGLNVIGNNVTNMNTLAFRGSTVSFADIFLGSEPNGLGDGAGGRRGVGSGVDASRTQLNFGPGAVQPTDRDLDLSLQGDGFFIVQDEAGEVRYTRAGRCDFVDDELVLLGQNAKVLTRDLSGRLVPISIAALRTNPAKATTEVVFQDAFKPEDKEHTIESFDVIDANGSKHTLKLVFTRDDTLPALNRYRMVVSEDDLEVGSGDLEFIGGFEASNSPVSMRLTFGGGVEPLDVTFNFDDVHIQNIGQQDSEVKVKRQDGIALGTITGKTFDEKGSLKLTYSNGQKADGALLALAQISDPGNLVQVGDALFEYRGPQLVVVREAADDLKVRSRSLEGSNVDLTTEFSQLVLMQRGYQASSQVLSTANDMLQELLDLRGGK